MQISFSIDLGSQKLSPYRLWGTRKTELVAEACVCLVGVALDKISHRIARTSTVHDLLSRVVRIDYVGPRDVAEIFTFFQLLSRLANLQ